MATTFPHSSTSHAMTISRLPLSYCTNVHPGLTLDAVNAGLDAFTRPAAENFGRPLAAGLWLAQPVIAELTQSPGATRVFAESLRARAFTCHTLNAFPFGNFHSERVKKNVYLPDWSTPERLQYTQECARVLATLLPDDCQGSISTVPLGFKSLPHGDGFLERCCDRLIALAQFLEQLEEETDKCVRLAIEPEPLCVLELTSETIAFFEMLRQRADDARAREAVERFIGGCYDVCHQAVEFEDVPASIRALSESDIRINKVHITCAVELDNPRENVKGREALAHFVEPRYMHQTMIRRSSGQIERLPDLTSEIALSPAEESLDADKWRIHFHVPVDADNLGPLGTTRNELKAALRSVAGLLYAPHLEVETYTWNVLPGRQQVALVDGLTRELIATRGLLDDLE